MKKTLQTICRSISLLGFVFLTLSSEAQAFCLQSFNGYGPAYAPKVEARTERFTREIVSQGCEVVQLQEIWNSNQIQTLVRLARQSYGIYAPNSEVKFGLMNLVQFQTTQKPEAYLFHHNDDGGLLDGGREIFGVQKGWTFQRLLIPEIGSELDFLNLHLHPASEAVRMAQLFEILQWRLQQKDRRPLVISGDFNMDPLSAEYFFAVTAFKLKDPVMEKWGRYPLNFCTYCSSNPLSWLNEDKVFDYVFFSQGAPLKTQDLFVDLMGTPKEPFSDHFGLRVVFSPSEGKDNRHIESERYFLLSILASMMDPVKSQYGTRSQVYKGLLALQSQLNKRSGIFWNYLSTREP